MDKDDNDSVKSLKSDEQAVSKTTKPVVKAVEVPEKPFDSRFAVPEPHQDTAPRIKALGGALLILVSLTAGFFGGWAGSNSRSNDALNSRSSQQQVISSESQLISSIAKDVSPSVVSVDVTGQAAASPTDFFSGFGTDDAGGSQPQRSAGTGIIIASNGLIVTNRHVVPQGTTKVSVTLSDGTELDDVQVVGRTRETDSLDLAFLKIGDAKGKKLTAATIGDSNKMVVGDKVVAIGNALGQFQNTVTSGILSGFGRSIQASDDSGQNVENLQDMFQTDAAINQGNSGGPLVNMSGEVIGINTAIAGNAQDIGFAIPTTNINGLIKTVISTGKFQQPYLGVRYQPITNDVAQQLNLKVTRGAYILKEDQAGGQPTVLPGTPAEKAGLQPGDIIVSVGGKKIDERSGLTVLLNQHGANDKVTLSILRDGKKMNIDVQLEPAPTSDN